MYDSLKLLFKCSPAIWETPEQNIDPQEEICMEQFLQIKANTSFSKDLNFFFCFNKHPYVQV